jgi:3-oxoacyl-[acyl-carrier protein] reductase
MKFAEKTAIVTGSSRGIGRAIALELGSQGANVVVNYHANADAANEVASAIDKSGGSAKVYQADVGNFEQAQALVKFAIDEFGGLNILVNNAGIIRDTLILTMKEEDWDKVIETNLKSTFNTAKAAARPMIRQRQGRIINITSVAGLMGNAGQTNYSASKAGQIGFTKALARELAPRGVTVNAVAAGFVETEIWAHVPEDAIGPLKDLIPLGRTGTTEEIAKAVAFLASDDAAYITGQVLAVDGGMAMH